jgi:hypothetical protein
MMPVVLILTHPADVHADAVQVHLEAAHVQVCRLDTATLGTPDTAVTALIQDGTVTGRLADCALEQVVGVWHRRPSEFTTTNTEDRAELRAGIGGVLATLPYLNHPAAMAGAEFSRCPVGVELQISAFGQLSGCVLKVIGCDRCGASMFVGVSAGVVGAVESSHQLAVGCAGGCEFVGAFL